MGRYIKGNLDEDVPLGTLNTKTLVSTTTDEAVEERTLVSSIVATYMLNNLTAPQGPLLFGVAHGAYTDAQIEQVIENTGSWAEGDLLNQEIAKRKVRIIGSFVARSLAGTVDVRFNDGKPVKTKLNWILNSDARLRFWVYNVSATALTTTVPNMLVSGHANLWPR